MQFITVKSDSIDWKNGPHSKNDSLTNFMVQLICTAKMIVH